MPPVYKNVGECIETQRKDFKIQTNQYLPAGEIPVIDQGADFIAGYIDDPAKAYTGPLPVIVFGDHTCCLKYVSVRFAVGADGTQLIRPNLDFSVRYFYYALRAQKMEHFGYQRHFKLLKTKDVSWFPLPTQRKIAAILSAYDDLIENNLRRIKILEEMAQNLYREWFVKFRFPGHQHARFTDSPLGRIPEGWEIDTVENTFAILGGGTPSKTVPEYWDEGTINWYSPTDLTAKGSMFMERSGKKISELGLKKSSARLFPPFSVMMTSRATLGVISINTTDACTNQGFITCVPNERFPLYMLYYWLKENVEYFISLGTGATFKEITKGVFKTIELVVPAQTIITQFENAVQQFALQVLNLQRKNNTLRRTRDLLLPRLISGEVDVAELDIAVPEEAVT